ncbi:two-component system, OmpR family, sensor kinase Ihk [Enterococcus sp. AZ194]|uniref:sensor histidine kinase n=1 Tax=Enterococcus sp. AZ194 TaxID=2774629 RepID=UPI003F1F3884
MKLRTKYFLYTTVIITIVVTLAFAGLYLMMPKYYTNEKTKELNQFSKKVKEKIDGQEWNPTLEEELTTLSVKFSFSVELTNEKKEVFYASNAFKIQGNPQRFDLDERLVEDTTSGETTEYVVPVNQARGEADSFLETEQKITFKNAEVAYLHVYYSLQPIDDAKDVLFALYPWTLGIGMLIGGLGAFVYSWLSTRRIKTVIQMTEKMQEMRDAQLITVSGKDEINDLAQNINYLYTSLGNTIHKLDQENHQVSELERSKAEFMRSASHELKTPLTALNSVLEGMIHQVGPYKDYEKYLAVCQKIVFEQEALINQILQLSKIDSVTSEVVSETFMLQEIYEENFLVYEVLAKKDQKKIIHTIENFEIYGVKEDFIRIWNNIFSNALRYSDEQSTISIKTTANRLELFNQCQPLSETEASRVFEPFYRPDYARNRKDGGTGIGLYIVSQLAKRNGWQYNFKASPDKKGMVFSLEF